MDHLVCIAVGACPGSLTGHSIEREADSPLALPENMSPALSNRPLIVVNQARDAALRGRKVHQRVMLENLARGRRLSREQGDRGADRNRFRSGAELHRDVHARRLRGP